MSNTTYPANVTVNGTHVNTTDLSIDVYKCSDYQVYFDVYNNVNCTPPINQSVVVDWSDITCVDIFFGEEYSFDVLC